MLARQKASLRGAVILRSTSRLSSTVLVSQRRDLTYGFIGLGQMGLPMAQNLQKKLSKGDQLLVNDLNPASTGAVLSQADSAGAKVEIVKDVHDLASRSEFVVTALPEPQHVQSLFDKILASPLPKPQNGHRVFIDCSTIDPITSRDVAAKVHDSRSGIFVDAPMSGGVVGSRAGTLTFMAGLTVPEHVSSMTEEELLQNVEGVLSYMGKATIHMGKQGTGLAAKLANNYLLAVSNIATAEAMNLGIKLGLDGKTLGGLINRSSGRCWSSEVNNPVPGISEGAPSSRDYEGGFGVKLMAKDLRLAVEAAAVVGVKLGMGEKTKEVYTSVIKADGGKFSKKDFSVVYKWLEKESK